MESSNERPELPSLFMKDASTDKYLSTTFHSELFFSNPFDFSTPKGELFPPMLFPLQFEEMMETQPPIIELKKKKSLNAKYKYSSKDLFGADGAIQQLFYCNMCSREFRHKSDPCEFCGKLLKTQGRSDAKRKHLERCFEFLKKFPTASRESITTAAKIAAASPSAFH